MDNFEIINYIYKNASMGYESTLTLLKTLENKENKIKDVVQDILNSYEQFTKDSKILLAKINKNGKKINKLASISADIGIKMEINKDNSDSRVAQMLIKGLGMGVNEMEKLFNDISKDIDNNIIDLINDFKDFQKNAINKLEKFV